MFKTGGSNMQNPTALSFLALVYAKYLDRAKQVIRCPDGTTTTPQRMISIAKSQVKYKS